MSDRCIVLVSEGKMEGWLEGSSGDAAMLEPSEGQLVAEAGQPGEVGSCLEVVAVALDPSAALCQAEVRPVESGAGATFLGKLVLSVNDLVAKQAPIDGYLELEGRKSWLLGWADRMSSAERRALGLCSMWSEDIEMGVSPQWQGRYCHRQSAGSQNWMPEVALGWEADDFEDFQPRNAFLGYPQAVLER